MADYILKEIKALSPENTVQQAQKICASLPISHVLVVKNKVLLGCFSESDVFTTEDKESLITTHSHLFSHFYSNVETSVLELLNAFAENDCTIIPVLNSKQEYIGYYELSDVLDLFNNSPFVHRNDETLLIEKNNKDYSMSEIAQIVESNGGQLLGCYIVSETSETVQVFLKIVSNEMNEIIQTFRRYNYTVNSKHQDDLYLEDLKNRAAYLNKYLDI